MKKRKLPGFTAESSLYSRGGLRYANSVGGSALKRNSVIAAENCWAKLLACFTSGTQEVCSKYGDCMNKEPNLE
jgi:hypothetical protein